LRRGRVVFDQARPERFRPDELRAIYEEATHA
jgi:hypothetical protein